MWMHKNSVSQYPACVKLLQNLPNKLSKTKVVLNAFLTACSQGAPNEAAAMRVASTKALKWGTGPLIIVHEGMLQVPQVGEIVEACGFTSSFDKVFRPGDKSTIEITSIFFDGFESGSPVDRPNNEHRLIVTFLHEAVHWVRDEVGAPNLVDPITLRGPRKEAGRFFEELAFGADKGVCTDEAIFDALLSRRL